MCPKIRDYAVSCLSSVKDKELQLYLLQLVQSLRYEAHHDSALARFLLSRALQNKLLGQFFFWHLKSEMHSVEVSERYSLILESFLRGSFIEQVDELVKQNEVLIKLQQVSNTISSEHKVTAISTTASNNSKTNKLRKLLTNIDLPHSFQLPLAPSIFVKGIIIDKSKVMDSAKVILYFSVKCVINIFRCHCG
jgi:hypothetical protein